MDEDRSTTDEQEMADDAGLENAQGEQQLDDKEGLPPQQEGDAPKEAQAADAPKEAQAAADKALRDTKVWATKLAQENAELKRIVSEFKQQTEDQAASEIDAIRQKVYEDYPELKGLLEPMIRDISDIKSKKAEDAEKREHQEALDYFNSHVKPEVLKVHPDFEAVLFQAGKANQGYFDWATKQRPSLRIAAMNSPDPEDIVWAVTEFKKYKGSDEAQALKKKQEDDRRQKLVNAQTLRGGKSTVPTGMPERVSDDDKPINEWISERNKKLYG